jgi:hypothetical protein
MTRSPLLCLVLVFEPNGTYLCKHWLTVCTSLRSISYNGGELWSLYRDHQKLKVNFVLFRAKSSRFHWTQVKSAVKARKRHLKTPAHDFRLFCLDSMLSTISPKSSQLCGDKVSLSDRPWMSSYIMCSDLVLTTFLESWSGGELDIASCRYGQLEIAIMHGDLEQIANWVEAPRSSSKHPWSKGWNPLMEKSDGRGHRRVIARSSRHYFRLRDLQQ